MTNLNDEPLVSVIIPTYSEGQRMVERAVGSVQEQSYSPIETIVVDSANQGWLQKLCTRLDGCKYAYQEPQGVSAARNLGLDQANGDVVAFLDADDYYLDKKLELQVASIMNGADIVYSDAYHISEFENRRKYYHSFDHKITERFYIDFFRHDGRKGNIPTSTIAVQSSCIGQRRFNERLLGGEDYHLWVQLFKEADRIDYVDKPLACVRQRNESLSSDPDMMYEDRLQAIELLCNRYPELRPYRRERELLERYDYARHIMFYGRTGDARSLFFELLTQERNLRAAVMFFVSIFPFGHRRIVKLLDDLYQRFR